NNLRRSIEMKSSRLTGESILRFNPRERSDELLLFTKRPECTDHRRHTRNRTGYFNRIRAGRGERNRKLCSWGEGGRGIAGTGEEGKSTDYHLPGGSDLG